MKSSSNKSHEVPKFTAFWWRGLACVKSSWLAVVGAWEIMSHNNGLCDIYQAICGCFGLIYWL